MNTTDVLLTNAAIIVGLLFALWCASVALKNAAIIDLFWGFGFVVVGWATYMKLDDAAANKWLLPTLVSIWGLRLSIYLAWRNHGRPEDYRYQAMRERAGSSFVWKSLFTVFWLQGAIMWLVSLSIQLGLDTPKQPPAWQIVAGVLVWSIGLLFEAIGDFQLARFKATPANAGKVMDRGLWRYTRHPNYFGDFMIWWGHFLIAVTPDIWWSVISPLVMSVFLMRVSGVTLLERTLKSSKQGYKEYVRTTNTFFPWPPRR